MPDLTERGFVATKPWPDWMLEALANAPDDVRIAGELIRGTGQRPAASIKMLRSVFKGEWVSITDEKGDKTFDIYCPARLRMLVESLEKGPRHVLAKSENAPRSYDSVEKSFRAWRTTLVDLAKEHGDYARRYTLHALLRRLSGAAGRELQTCRRSSCSARIRSSAV
ncbi:hypothetical protein [Antarcticimicrobium sediminis]|uniref:Phage integrase family protein n=1 Tax=Antarcticimicrobium sediminis TaxID=2546227 RepID=A0A4R5EEX1_9RHOB|nr:hypothetical protein [Antarcticimicrobium sediminis]TDE32901.1 hypothetical protein E1B25_21830 [Antarcticimicrobium sediminis]